MANIGMPGASIIEDPEKLGEETGADIVSGIVWTSKGIDRVYEGWGYGGEKGALNGAVGGAQIVAGTSALFGFNPYVAGAIMATSILGNTIKTGKHEDQYDRDAMRSFFKKRGYVDDKFNLTLADGSTFNIGVDGGGGRHSVRNPNLLVKADTKRGGSNKLYAYDVDYTNDLDYFSGTAGISLSRLLAGGKAKQVDQLGGQLGNGALSSVGYGQDFTEENFNKVKDNLIGVYASTGIKTKEDAYQLANQAFAEGRIDSNDLVSMQQTFNMMYDRDGYKTATDLMAGRYRGVEVAGELPDQSNTVDINKPNTFKPVSEVTPMDASGVTTKDLMVNRNRKTYSNRPGGRGD